MWVGRVTSWGRKKIVTGKDTWVGVKNWLLINCVIQSLGELEDDTLRALWDPLDKVLGKDVSKVMHRLALYITKELNVRLELTTKGKVSSINTTCPLVIIFLEEGSRQM